MSQRDAIAGILRIADPTFTLLWSDAEKMADAILEHFTVKPKPATRSVDDFDHRKHIVWPEP